MAGAAFRSPQDRAAAVAFFQGRDEAHRLFHLVLDEVAVAGPFELAATKSRVSCVAATRFLWVHEAHADGSIWLGFLLPHALDSPRVRSGRLPSGRWSHHIKLSGPADLDSQLVSWLREACAADRAAIADAPVRVTKRKPTVKTATAPPSRARPARKAKTAAKPKRRRA